MMTMTNYKNEWEQVKQHPIIILVAQTKVKSINGFQIFNA